MNKEHDAFFQDKLSKAISVLQSGLHKQTEKRDALVASLYEIQKIKNYILDLSDRTKMWKINVIIHKCSKAKIYQTGNIVKDCIYQMSEEEVDKIYRDLESIAKY